MRRRPLIGPVQLTRFIRQRLTVFLLTLFTMLGGYSGRKVRLHRRSRSTQQTSARPRRRAVRRLSQVLFLRGLLLPTNREKQRKPNRLLFRTWQRTTRAAGRKAQLWGHHRNRVPSPPPANRLRVKRALNQPKCFLREDCRAQPLRPLRMLLLLPLGRLSSRLLLQ